MNFEELLKARFSVRKFAETLVEREKLDKVLQAGRLAPTAKNSQLQKFAVFTGKELEKVDECTPCRYGAPAVILVCYELTERENWGIVGATIATTAMMFQAQDLGLGTCWVQNFDSEKTKQVLNLPSNIIPVAFLPIGYADIESSRYHGVRKPMTEFMI